jgi:hypothetical protein
MAGAQLLKVTTMIDDRVREVANNVLVVDNRVAGVDDNDRVACVDDREKDFDNRVKVVDNKIAAVNGGDIFYPSS